MAKVSVIIPARNEKYLIPTISDVLSKAAGDVEVVAVLEDCAKANFIPSVQEWSAVQAQWSNRLTTIYHTQSKGMRPAINAAAASAISRGAKYLFKLDAHCSVAEGWDETLKADCDKDWIVVPRRKRLDPTTWTLQDVGKPDVDYHYLSFPDDPNDFGGPGLNGKVWYERIKARLDKSEYEIDDEMSSQGSAWFMHAEYFTRMGFMDTESYGPFWNEFQELGLSCWLSGGQVKVNKRTWYAHWHKGRAGRGYHLPESWLKMGRNFTMNWLYNEANPRQTRPFKWIIEHFAPVPGWPEDWEKQVYSGPNRDKIILRSDRVEAFKEYAERRNQAIGLESERKGVVQQHGEKVQDSPSLRIIEAYYGPKGTELDVTKKVRELVNGDTLDLMVGNSVLGVGNPFRGQKKKLRVVYGWNNHSIFPAQKLEKVTDERDWLIIGQSTRYVGGVTTDDGITIEATGGGKILLEPTDVDNATLVAVRALASPESKRAMNETDLQDHAKKAADWIHFEQPPLDKEEKWLKFEIVNNPVKTPAALNDFLIRKFNIPSHRLRGPMPIEVNFHRNDLAQLFAELGFNRGAEVGVAEGKYSEVLLKANPEMELLLVDPWHAYSENPQNKTGEKHKFAYGETIRRTTGYPGVSIAMQTSMEAVREVAERLPEYLLDFVYIDGHHGFDYVMQDLIEWSKRVRSGGIVSGDDFYYLDPKRWGAGPVEAVMAYTQAHKINPWFIFQGHKSIDFMWVKQ